MTGLVLRAVSRYELAAAGTAAATEDEATELATAAPAPVS
jgi:hypothetical protein